MAVALFVLAGFLLVEENIHRAVAGWGTKMQIFAYLDGNLAADAAKPLLIRVAAYPEIETVRFVSQNEAWESFKKSLGSQSGVIEGLSAEALPASFEIALKPSARDPASSAEVVRRLRAERGIAQVDYPQEWTEKLDLLLRSIESAKWVFGGVLLIAAFFIVGNAAKLAIAARRDEIEIMQLVGAPPGSIRFPFVIEGVVQGLVGAALALLFLAMLFHLASAALADALDSFNMSQMRFLQAGMAAMLVLLGCSIGAAGSFFALRRRM
jgi:cell division transport system permease protein